MTTLRIYKAPSGQWAGQLLDDGGLELAGVAGCEDEDGVLAAAERAGMEFAGVVVVDAADEAGTERDNLDTIKSMMILCKAKGWDDVVRLLDQSEVMGTAWGKACTMQVIDYGTSNWVNCTPKGKAVYSMAHWYKLIRSELAWDGPVRLAVAAK